MELTRQQVVQFAEELEKSAHMVREFEREHPIDSHLKLTDKDIRAELRSIAQKLNAL